jgi:hypothetical protein
VNPTSNIKERLETEDTTGFEKLRRIDDMVTPYEGTGTEEWLKRPESAERCMRPQPITCPSFITAIV